MQFALTQLKAREAAVRSTLQALDLPHLRNSSAYCVERYQMNNFKSHKRCLLTIEAAREPFPHNSFYKKIVLN